jgi:hypothetical protein
MKLSPASTPAVAESAPVSAVGAVLTLSAVGSDGSPSPPPPSSEIRR